MNDQVAVSFEDGFAKLAYGSQKNGTLVVHRTLTVKDEEFDAFLSREKTKDFIVVHSFRTFYQDVFFLPPTDEKYFDALLKAEIRKNAPELHDFVFFYSVLREKVHEGRPVKETFVFAADSTEVESILERFSRYQKRVKGLYTDVFSLTGLIGLTPGSKEKTILGTVDLEGRKTIFLLREGKLSFARVIQSKGRGIDQYDMTNINMTVNHARQTLREQPTELVFVNTGREKPEIADGLTLPFRFLEYPADVFVPGEGGEEFFLPISGLLAARESGKRSLLPLSYTGLLVQKRILSWCIAFFTVSSLLCMAYILAGWHRAYELKKVMAPLKAEMAGRESIYSEFQAQNSEFQQFLPLITYWKKAYSGPDIQKAMVALQAASMDKVRVKDIEIKHTAGGELAIQVKGRISADTYGDLQSNFRKLTESLKGIEGMQGLSQKLDLANKDFVIELAWRQ